MPEGKRIEKRIFCVRILCIDFDGVIHSYESGWKGPRNIPDPPVEGAISWLKKTIQMQGFKICIFSSRSRYFFARRAMKKWLAKHGLTKDEIALIDFPRWKPAAFLTIDDRCWRFKGKFPRRYTIKSFRPWNKKGI